MRQITSKSLIHFFSVIRYSILQENRENAVERTGKAEIAETLAVGKAHL